MDPSKRLAFLLAISYTAYMKTFFTSWKYYIRFLWLLEIMLICITIYGIVMVERSPASGLAMAGIVPYFLGIILLACFIALNYYLRRKMLANPKSSNRYLLVSWILIGIAAILVSATMIISHNIQTNYEHNIQPKLDACYQDYLDGKRSTPYENCVNS